MACVIKILNCVDDFIQTDITDVQNFGKLTSFRLLATSVNYEWKNDKISVRGPCLIPLKKAIKKEKENDLKAINADKLQLYLGKASDVMWLESSSEDVQSLKEGGKD
jgi:hypothetical protein